jgi:GNAT superfamily N-acetyltransferase
MTSPPLSRTRGISVAVATGSRFPERVTLTWLDRTRLDPRDVAGAVAVLEAVRRVDTPAWMTESTRSLTANLTYGWDAEPTEAALLRDRTGRPVGLLRVDLPCWDNRHLGLVDVRVDPLHRRQGLGRTLFRAGVQRLRAEGRRMVLIESVDCAASVGFAAAMGLERAQDVAQRRQDLTALDWARLDSAYDEANAHATGYELLRLPGAVPESMRSAVCDLTAAINDAPLDQLDIEDESFTPERLLASEHMQGLLGRRIYRLVARETATGVLAGVTVVSVDSEQPWHAEQYDTSVVRGHRGHRLGVLLKIGMLRWLREQEPQLREIDTWNAVSNAHMIGVNELLGYEVLLTGVEWQLHL